VRNGRISTHCSLNTNYGLVFGRENQTNSFIVTSRSLLTPSYNLSLLTQCLENGSTRLVDGLCYPAKTLDNEEDSVTTSVSQLFSVETLALSTSELMAMATAPPYDVDVSTVHDYVTLLSGDGGIVFTDTEPPMEATPTSHTKNVIFSTTAKNIQASPTIKISSSAFLTILPTSTPADTYASSIPPVDSIVTTLPNEDITPTADTLSTFVDMINKNVKTKKIWI